MPQRPNKLNLKSLSRYELLKFWILERESMRLRKRLKRKPYTQYDVLARHHWCNVNRQNDRVTKAINSLWRDENKDDPDLWFAMMVARWINQPRTLEAIGYPVPFDEHHVTDIMHHMTGEEEAKAKKDRHPIWNGAYMVTTHGRKVNKIDHIISTVCQRAWDRRESIRPRSGDSLKSFSGRLLAVDGYSNFMVCQMVADLKYVQLREAEDWGTFALPGPGSKRGMAFLTGENCNNAIKWEREFQTISEKLRDDIEIVSAGIDLSDGHDIQNCLCEYSQLCQALEGKKLSRRYKPFNK